MVVARQMLVSDLLSGPTQFQVPLFQRPYQWSRRQWDALFDDVALLALSRQATPADRHFLGPLVTTQSDGSAASAATSVVDGQQRLLTLTALLCALRDSGHPLGTGSRQAIEGCTHRTVRDNSAVARLRLLPKNEGDRHALLMIVEGEESLDDHELTKAYRHFITRLDSLRDDKDPNVTGVTVAQFARAALKGLEIVRITAQAGDSANRIYETLNNRGEPLKQGDLIRNYIFMRLGSDGQKFYETTWKSLDERFKGEELTHLFWLDLVRHRPTITQGQTYAQQTRRLASAATNEQLKAAIRAIDRRGDIYELIRHPEFESNGKVRDRLKRLKAWGSTTVDPILMYLLELREQDRATSSQIEKAMLYIESYYVRRMVTGRATMNMNRVLLAAGDHLDRQLRKRTGAPTVDVAFRRYLSGEGTLTSSPDGKKWGTDEKVLQDVSGNPFYRHGKAHQKALVLRWIEEGLSSKDSIPSERLTIEHVMPQTITGTSWLRDLRAGLTPREDAHTVYRQLLHTIGNLTLVTPEAGASLSNRSFSDKKDWLRENGAGLKITAEITGKHAWLPDHIRNRSELMARRIIKFWPGPLPQDRL